MATFGDVRFQLSKIHPGVDHDLLDAWILEGYQHVLGELDWQRLDAKVSIAIPAKYDTGTVALTKGSTAITGTGTTWATEMTNRMFRVAGESAYYNFTFLTATTGTLDRPYEGETASGLSYSICKNVYPMPSDCRWIQAVGGLELKSRCELPTERSTYGVPRWWTTYPDSFTAPPVMQVEVYPVPEEAGALMVSFLADGNVTSIDTTASLLPWVYPAAIKAYVSAQVSLAIEKDGAAAERWMAALGVHVGQMRKQEAAGRQPIALRPPVAPHRVQSGLARNWRRS